MVKFACLICLMALGISSYAQPKKKGSGPPKATVNAPAGIPYSDTLQTFKDTTQVRYYMDIDSGQYVGVFQGYLVKTIIASPRVRELRTESNELFDEAWKPVVADLISNYRPYMWKQPTASPPKR